MNKEVFLSEEDIESDFEPLHSSSVVRPRRSQRISTFAVKTLTPKKGRTNLPTKFGKGTLAKATTLQKRNG